MKLIDALLKPFLAVRQKFLKEYLEDREECLNPPEVNIDDLDPETTKHLEEFAEKNFPKIQEMLKKEIQKSPPKPDSIEIGQVWLTKTIHDDAPDGPFGPKVVIVVNAERDDDIIKVIPISDYLGFASREDLILNPSSGMPEPLNDWVMAELWAEQNILTASLDHYFGSISDKLFNTIQTLRGWLLDFEKHPVEASVIALPKIEYLGTRFVAEKWSFIDPVTAAKYEVILGQKIRVSGDPRVNFYELEHQDMEYLRTPYMRKILAEI